jgi:hypothetical protein
MTDMHTVRASGPDDLLALVPSLLGFHPESSVVLLTVGDARHRFHARVDLPDDPPGVEELTGYLAEVASRHGLTRAAAVVYTQDAVLADAVAGELDRRLDLAGVDLVCVIRADGERWWPFHGGDEGPGTPYDVGAHPLMAQAVLDGTLVRRNRQELADSLVGDDPEAVERVAGLAEEVTGRLAHALSASAGAGERRAHLAVEGRWVRSRVCRHLEDGVRLDDHDLARMLTLLAVSLEVRDVAWAEMSHANAEQHVALWLDAVRRSPVDLRAAPASLLGFAAWLAGEGALAWCAVDCAQEAEPDYGLAALLTQALAGAVPPSAWQPIPREVLTLFAD